MIITSICIREGEVIAPWYYGFSYFLPDREAYVFLPIPLNFLVRWARMARYKWDSFRSGQDIWSRELAEVYHHAFWEGRLSGRKKYRREGWNLLARVLERRYLHQSKKTEDETNKK